ncbi:MAG TPA: ABC transporter substrate-binding protein [Candidatus Eisenbacteria bacterium]|nr:ABC transporter substrate-binding protein [Candidatus Eisenbacteria bacterium]
MKIITAVFLLAAVLAGPGSGWPVDRVYVSHSAVSGSQAVLFVTRDAGFFKKYDLDPRIVFVSGAPPNIAALVSGEIDLTVFAGPAAIASGLEGADTVVLMTFINTMEHTFISRPNVRKPADLKGKKFGIARPGATDDYGARVAFRKWGLEADRDVTMLAVGTQPSRFAAVKSGVVDATLLQPPFTVRARQEGLTELGSLGELGLDYLGTSLATTRQTIQKKESIVKRFVRALVEGIHFYKTQKEASIQSIAKFTKLTDRAALEEAYNTYAIKYMERAPYPAIKGVEAILEDLARTNPKAKTADPKKFIEPRFLKELEDSGFIAQLYKTK